MRLSKKIIDVLFWITKMDKTEPTGRPNVLQSSSQKPPKALEGLLLAKLCKICPRSPPSFIFSLCIFPQSFLKILFRLNMNIICDFIFLWRYYLCSFSRQLFSRKQAGRHREHVLQKLGQRFWLVKKMWENFTANEKETHRKTWSWILFSPLNFKN